MKKYLFLWILSKSIDEAIRSINIGAWVLFSKVEPFYLNDNTQKLIDLRFPNQLKRIFTTQKVILSCQYINL
jgi:hypothetical protein